MIVQILLQSRDSFGTVRWPDGGAILDQPVKLTQAFALIQSEIARRVKDTA